MELFNLLELKVLKMVHVRRERSSGIIVNPNSHRVRVKSAGDGTSALRGGCVQDDVVGQVDGEISPSPTKELEIDPSHPHFHLEETFDGKVHEMDEVPAVLW